MGTGPLRRNRHSKPSPLAGRIFRKGEGLYIRGLTVALSISSAIGHLDSELGKTHYIFLQHSKSVMPSQDDVTVVGREVFREDDNPELRDRKCNLPIL